MTDHNNDLRSVPLDDIDVEEGFNPRSAPDAEALEELTASIRQRGVLQPLLLTHDEQGTLRLVAGHRRLEAARAAGLHTVPALVRTDADLLEHAISENVLRQDLNPIEEAHALQRALKQGRHSQKALAARLGKSTPYVRQRMRLLRLPEQAQQAIAAGQLPLSVAPELERIAKVSPAVTEACVALVQAGHATAHDFERDPARVVGMIQRVQWTDGAPVAVPTQSGLRPETLPLGEHGEEITQRYRALTENAGGYSYGISLAEEDDAARAYGCLLEFKRDGGYLNQAFLCDATFIADRCLARLDDMEREVRERAQRRSNHPHQDGLANSDRAAGDKGDGIDDKEVRRQERERQQDEAAAARGANLELGRQLAERFHKPKLTTELARLVALLVLQSDAATWAARGLRYVDPRLQDTAVRELKSGEKRTKITYAARQRCGEELIARLDRAESGEEILGVVAQTVIAAHFADEQVTAQSHRIGPVLPRAYGYTHDGQPAHFDAIRRLVEQLAKPALPARTRNQLTARNGDADETPRTTETTLSPTTTDDPSA